jgi:sporulation protein YlmC with PRC-barrel domain
MTQEADMSYLDRDVFGIYRDSYNQGPGPHLMGADTLIGEDVYNREEESLGDIKEIMIDMQSGQISYAVLSFGGVFGIGSKLFAVPWGSLELDTANKRFVLDASKEQLKNAPGFDKDAWPDMASAEFGDQINDFYDVPSMARRPLSTGAYVSPGVQTLQSGASQTLGGSRQDLGGNLNQGSIQGGSASNYQNDSLGKQDIDPLSSDYQRDKF